MSMEKLRTYYFGLYGENGITQFFFDQLLVVGGGVMEMKDFPREEFEKAVNEKVGTDVMGYGFRYIYSREYVGKGVIGAAVFARNRLQDECRKEKMIS